MKVIKAVDLQPGMNITSIELPNLKVRTIIRLKRNHRIRIYFNDGEYINLSNECNLAIE